MIVVSAGTGGTVAGIGRKIREKLPHVKVKCAHTRSYIDSQLTCTYPCTCSIRLKDHMQCSRRIVHVHYACVFVWYCGV